MYLLLLTGIVLLREFLLLVQGHIEAYCSVVTNTMVD